MRLYFYLLLTSLSLGVAAQTAQVEFGKNRVQYHKDFDEWEQYESDNFITYWYGDNQGLGQAVVQFAEYDFAYIQKMLEHRMNNKVQLIVYRDVTDVKQSNIGSEEVFTLGGAQGINRATGFISPTETKFLGNKAFVYFNGDHTDLRRQVREAMAGVYIEHMLYGSSVQEVVQNAVLLNLPPWFKSGLVAYLGQEWNTDLDDQLRQLLASGEYADFEELAVDYPRLAGHSFWYFISETLGKPTVSNLLYLTRINRSVENGFLYVLGNNYESVLFNWKDFYKTRFQSDLNGTDSLLTTTFVPIKNKKRLPLTNIQLSPDGSKIAYVLNEIGRYKVYIQDLATGEREMIHKGGQRNVLQATDYNYPLLDWSPTNQELAVLYEFRDQPKLLLYNVQTGKGITDILSVNLDRVYSMAYADPGSMILTTSAGGFTDIVQYFPASRQSFKITNDFWDDLDAVPVRVRGRQGIVFASNRVDSLKGPAKLDTVLPITNFDLYYYDLEGKPGEFVRITNTPFANERQPAAIDGQHFSFLSDLNGISNRFQAHLEDFVHHYDKTIYLETGDSITLHADSTFTNADSLVVDSVRTFPIIRERAVVEAVTNRPINIDLQDGSGKLPLGVEAMVIKGTPVVRRVTFDTTQTVDLAPTAYRRSTYLGAGQVIPDFTNNTRDRSDPLIAPNQPAAPRRDPDEDFLFQTRFEAVAEEPDAPEAPANDPEILNDDGALILTPPDAIDPDSLSDPLDLTVVEPTGPPAVLRDAPTPSVLDQLSGERPVPELNRIYKFRPGKIIPYRVTFRASSLKTTMDNDPLFAGLNSFAANPDGFTRQPLGILAKADMTDLMEDYTIEGGIRVPTSFNGTEYFLTAENKKHRLDYIASVYRRNRRLQEGSFRTRFSPRLVNENTLLGQFGVRYPLDVFTSVRLTATLRRDRVQTLSTELAALESDPISQQRAGIRAEYVFDNTLVLAKNLRMGTRYKVYTDFYKSFNISLSGDSDMETGFRDGFLGLIGFDARHYQRILKKSVLAFRLAGASNFGAQKILYYLGGSDNSLIQNFNENIPTPTTGDFELQDLANPLRGFDINIRNGGTYILGNAEARIPVFNYLFPRVRSSLIRDFQLVGFFDIGSAWAGRDPYDEDNPVNITTYPDPSIGENSNISIRVRRFREPFVYSYGMGARTTVFGYFIRVDYGWGVETGNTLDPMFHFSLGYDF